MSWHRNQDGENQVSDFTTFRRYPQYCTNQAQPTTQVTTQANAPVGAPAGAPGKDGANLANTATNTANTPTTSSG